MDTIQAQDAERIATRVVCKDEFLLKHGNYDPNKLPKPIVAEQHDGIYLVTFIDSLQNIEIDVIVYPDSSTHYSWGIVRKSVDVSRNVEDSIAVLNK